MKDEDIDAFGTSPVPLSVSDDAVWPALRKAGIQLQRHRSWSVSTAPEIAAKACRCDWPALEPAATPKTLNNASFQSIKQLVAAIHAFTAAYDERAAPFVWRKPKVRGARLRNTIVNLCN